MDRGLMADATSADDAPVSGFQLSEIAKATKSSYQANTQIQQYLVERLAKPHHNTKFKALMIIKHVCRTGRPEFKREMGRNVDAIRECLQFKGPPDPLRGDEIYRRVRDCAREVLEALFDGQMPVTTSAVAAANRIQGMGNDFTPPEPAKPTTTAYLSSIASAVSTAVMGDGQNSPKYTGHPGATGGFGSASSMASNNYDPRAYGSGGAGGSGGSGGSGGGFGNPNLEDPRNEKTWLQKASALASSAASAAGFGKSETSEPLQGSGMGGGGGGGGFTQRSSGTFNRAAFSNPEGGGLVGGGGSTFNRAAFSNPDGANGGYNYASNRGPNAIHANSSPYTPQPFSAGPPPPQPFVPEMPQHTPGFGRAGGAMDNGNYEKGIIDSLCEPGGLRPVPPEDKLQEFLNTASTLSEDIVGNCLLDVLNDESWQSRTKALIVLAQLMRQPGCEAHRRWWMERADVVDALQSDAKANVRTQAGKTLRAIDPTAAPPPAAAPAGPRRISSGRGSFTGPGAGLPDNMSEMGTTITEEGSQAISDDGEQGAAAAAPAPVLEPVREPTPPPVEVNLLDMDDLDVPAPAPAAAAPASVLASPASGIPSVVTMSSQVSVSPLAHEHDGPTSPPQPTAASIGDSTLEAESLFAGLSVGSAAVPTPAMAPPAVPAVPAPPAAAASVFDFLDAAVSAPVPAAPAPQPAPEVDLFGSLTIAPAPMPSTPQQPAPAQAAAPAAPAAMTSGARSLLDEFAGLMDPAPTAAASSGFAGGAAPGSAPAPAADFLAQFQQLTPEQQQMVLMNMQQQQGGPRGPPPPPGANAQGLYLTRPLPAQPGYGYGYPPCGAPVGMGMPMGAPGPRPMMPGMPGGIPLAGAVPMAPRPPMPVPMGGSPQPAIQLRQGASVIAPGMLSHTAERKNIPIAEGQGGSGFGFMGGSSGKSASNSGADSFSFVTDAIKGAQK